MSDLVRKQVYITRDQEALLKRKAARLGRSEAEIIRAALDSEAHKLTPPLCPAEKWLEERQFILERSAAAATCGPGIRKKKGLHERENPD